jgi:hypothetical protein
MSNVIEEIKLKSKTRYASFLNFKFILKVQGFLFPADLADFRRN